TIFPALREEAATTLEAIRDPPSRARDSFAGTVGGEGGGIAPHPGWGWKTRLVRTGVACERPEVEQQAGKRLRVLDLVQTLSDRAARPADELQLLVGGRRWLPSLDALGGEQMHAFAADPRRCPERRELTPAATGQAALLLQLAPGGLERLLALLGGPGRKLEQ